MRVLIADKLPSEIRVDISRLGYEVEFRPELGADDLPDAVGDVHVLVVRSTRVTEQTLEAAPHLQLIVRAGAGVNTIACDEAAARGIYVANCPGRNAIAVAELAMGLVLALDRRIPDNVAAMRAGRWDKSGLSKGAAGLFGRRMGVVGFGTIGREVARRAQAFGMHVLAWSRSLTDEVADEADVERCDDLKDLCARSDVVSVHVALTPSTKHLIGRDELAAMRPGAMVVHTARGGVVDDAALAEAVAEGRVRAAADVFEDEPSGGSGDFGGPLKDLAGFYGTHHIGASTRQAQEAVASEVVRILAEFAVRGEVRSAVNVWERPPAAGILMVRHLDRVGVLASVLDVLRGRELNVQDMENTIFGGGEAACARITLSDAPPADVLERLSEASAHVLGVEWIEFPPG